MKPNRVPFSHWREPFATHQPILYELANRIRGPILEFGCGEGSTRLLHEISRQRGIPLLTLESDHEWLVRYAHKMQSELHRFRQISDWSDALSSSEWDEERYGLVFVDQSPWEARAATVKRFRLLGEYIVLHDCDYLAQAGLLGKATRELRGPDDLGERQYDDVFSSWKEFFPLEPWPLPETGPPTLVGSNFHDCSALEIPYESFQPSRTRQIVVRGMVPVLGTLRRLRRRIKQ